MRYFTKPRGWIEDDVPWDAPSLPTLTVVEHDAADTGLVTSHGDAILRAPNPMGFGRDEEW